MALYQRQTGFGLNAKIAVPPGIDEMTELQNKVWLDAMRAVEDMFAAFWPQS